MNIKDEAFKDFKNGLKYREIAEKYGVSENTVKSWASRYWKNEKVATRTKKKLQTATGKNATENKVAKIVTEEVAKAVEENDELNDRQKEFCVRYMQNRNATQAYLRVYNCSYSAAATNACLLLKNPKIKAELKRLRAIKNTALGFLCAEDVVEMHMRIAFADITDFVDFKSFRRPVIKNGKFETAENPKTGEEIEVTEGFNEVSVHDSSTVDGTLITEISTDGGEIRIKLADKMRSLRFLEEYFELNPKDVNKKKYDEARLALEREKLELLKNSDEVETEDTSDIDGEIYGQDNLPQ